MPAVVARDLAKGGQLQVIVPASTPDGLPRARLKLSDQAAAAGLSLGGRMVRFSVNFRMES